MPKIAVARTPGELSLCRASWQRPDAASLILGLDLGTHCGYACAWYRPGHERPCLSGSEMLGQLDLSAGPYDSGAVRFVRLRHFLAALMPALVAYEEVRFTPAEAVTRFSAARVLARCATASELIGAFRATVATWCEEHNVPCVGFPIGTIKRRATARGNANKADMIAACNEQAGTDFDAETYEQTGVDNIADAYFVSLLAAEQYAAGLAAGGEPL